MDLSTNIVRSVEELRALRQLLAAEPAVGLDYETSGPEIVWRGKSRPDVYRHTITGFSVATLTRAWYVPVRHDEGGNVPLLAAKAFIADLFDFARLAHQHHTPSRGSALPAWVVVWNGTFELQISKNEGIDYGGTSDWLDDASISAWLAGWKPQPGPGGLKALANERYGYDLPDWKRVARGRQACEMPVAEVAEYACKDPWLTLRLWHDSLVVVREREVERHYRELDMPLVEIVRGMQERGVPVDRAVLGPLRDEVAARCDRLASEFRARTTVRVQQTAKARVESGEFYKNGKPKLKVVEVPVEVEAGADISNDHHVSRWLYDELKLWPTKGLKRNGAGNWPCDKETIERFAALDGAAGELARMRLEYQKFAKLQSTYLDVMLEIPPQYADGCLHTSYAITGTQTQRFSSSSPNLQNIPARSDEAKIIRRALVARPGFKCVIYDYSQIELRIVAHLARCQAMECAYLFGEDLHAMTLNRVQEVWPEAKRTDAKIGNFSTIYRITAEALAVKMRCSIARAQQMIDAFYAVYPEVSTYHDAAIRKGTRDGYVPTLDGYRWYLDRRRDGTLSHHEQNKAINYPVQGSAGGLIKKAMVALHRRWREKDVLGTRAFLVQQTHDELGAEIADDFVEEGANDMRECMESAAELRVPVVADGGVGRSWAEAKG